MMLARHRLALGLFLVAACGGKHEPGVERSRSAGLPNGFPSEPAALAVVLAVPAESLRAAGEDRYRRQAYDSAQSIWQVELARAQRAGDPRAEARVRMWLGLAAYRLGDYATARREGDISLAMKRRLGMDDELSRSFNALGLLAWNEGRHLEALRQYDSAIASARRNSDTVGVVRAAANVPLVKQQLGDFDGARRGFEEAIAAAGAIGDDRTQGNALANLATLEIALGGASNAIALLARARAHYVTIGYLTGQANALGQLATAWASLGDLQRAIATADSGLALARAQGLLQEVASDLEVIADLHVQAGNLRLALQRLREADSLDAAIGLVVERGTNLRRMATSLLELGEASASVARAREALAAHSKSDAYAEVVYDRLQLAQSLSRAGDKRAARVEGDVASLEAARLANPVAIRDAAAVVARVALDAGEAGRALSGLDRSSDPGSLGDWRLSDLRAEALLALGRLDDARHEGERAVAALERERASLGIGPLRSAYLANRVGPFSRLVAIHLARGDTVAAFEVAATLPGRSLVERLGGLTHPSTAIASIAEEERLLARAAALEQEMATQGAAPELVERRRALERALETTRAEYEELLAHRAPSPDARLLGGTRVSLREVQSQLASDEALLNFVSGPDRVDLFVVRAHSITYRAVSLGDRAIAGRIRVVRELVAGKGRSAEALEALGEMYDLLVGPALGSRALEGVERIRIVPHGSLVALPFAALRNRATGRFLIEDKVIAYLPSAAALGVMRQPAAAVGHLVAFAPFAEALPGTIREARAIDRVLGGAELRLGAASSEAALRVALEHGLSVHIASHGEFNAQNPLFSRMVIGRVAAPDAPNDGRLEVHEILGLHTTSPLVFLSGCETGLGTSDGPFAQGIEEGSLAQAFLVAGAGSVVATLWPVDDTEAERVAESFYRHVAAGRSPEDALASAQREAIRRQTGGFTWGAYAVSGTSRANPRAVSVKRGVNP
ncbi:MAG TPA: CHAT domain-containing protein [Gemmatimonadaceae bacterium]|nr:CHAT domain-containing protein [Gemmatimonadaceae bacterium]